MYVSRGIINHDFALMRKPDPSSNSKEVARAMDVTFAFAAVTMFLAINTKRSRTAPSEVPRDPRQ